MKTIISILILASTFSMVGCHKYLANKLNVLLHTVDELNIKQDDFWKKALTQAGETGFGDGDGVMSLVNYHPAHGKDRLVVQWEDTKEEPRFFGLELEGIEDLLFSLIGLGDAAKKTALEDFMKDSIVSRLHKVGIGDHVSFHRNDNDALFSLASESGKDLESMGARIEMNISREFGEKLVADYGLSEGRAQKVAKTINAYQRLTSKRSLTPREQNAYTQELLGVDYKKAERAFMQGDNFDQLMEDAAVKNGTSPEQVSAIIRDMIL